MEGFNSLSGSTWCAPGSEAFNFAAFGIFCAFLSEGARSVRVSLGTGRVVRLLQRSPRFADSGSTLSPELVSVVSLCHLCTQLRFPHEVYWDVAF